MLAGKQVFFEKGDPLPQTSIDSATRLRSVVGRLSRRLRPTVSGTGLTPTRISVLFTVARMGPLRISDLAEIEGLNPTMLSRVIAELAVQGLVRRVVDPADRRAALVDATAAGRRTRAKILNERSDVLNLQLAQLTEQERRLLDEALPLLETLAERLKDRRA
jgi:DNA-binding MarR family transcriptional regulator